MITGMDIVEEARTQLGVRFHHQARARDTGLDCIGLLVVVAQGLGLPIRDCTEYKRFPDEHTLMRELFKQLDHIPVYDAGPGDIGVFWYAEKGKPQHVGFFTDRGLLHTYYSARKVVEQEYSDWWKERLMYAFRYRGLG